jgi:hypothetical protein
MDALELQDVEELPVARLLEGARIENCTAGGDIVAIFERYVKRSGAAVIGRAKNAIAKGQVGEVELDFGVTRFPPKRSTWINPAWRWFHGENHDVGYHALSPSDADPDSWTLVTCRQCRSLVKPEWFGLPRPRPLVWDAANHLSERFAHVRDHAWLEAIAYAPGKWTGTLAEVQANMPEWPTLFAFHAWTAAWLAIGCGEAQEQEQLVYLDQLEERFIGDACRGRGCEANVP